MIWRVWARAPASIAAPFALAAAACFHHGRPAMAAMAAMRALHQGAARLVRRGDLQAT